MPMSEKETRKSDEQKQERNNREKCRREWTGRKSQHPNRRNLQTLTRMRLRELERGPRSREGEASTREPKAENCNLFLFLTDCNYSWKSSESLYLLPPNATILSDLHGPWYQKEKLWKGVPTRQNSHVAGGSGSPLTVGAVGSPWGRHESLLMKVSRGPHK